ncbi:peptidoglycan-binding domain-containing protein [Roseomonas sp. BN140053]|uniref:peptidoglycan-binding domain-containing protein n=1 Tax=Roseomonas sp. BN140053 TaxID=3391898 RepID=UPI0039E8C8F5
MLSIGDRGDAVRQLQRALVGQGYVLTAGGVFGKVTEVAVQQFQERHGLEADGVVRPMTNGVLRL